MTKIEEISIISLIKHLSNLNRKHYKNAEKFFTKDFEYLEKSSIENMIYIFLEDLNNKSYKYEIQKIKKISKTVYLVYAKFIKIHGEKIYHDTIASIDISLLILKKINDQFYLSDAFEFKNTNLNSIYSALQRFR